MARLTERKSATDQTIRLVGTESGGADPNISADVVATVTLPPSVLTGDTPVECDVISVINIETREHWQLIVLPLELAKT